MKYMQTTAIQFKAPPPHFTVPLSVPVVDDLNMLMHAVADDATPIIKVSLPLHGIGDVIEDL